MHAHPNTLNSVRKYLLKANCISNVKSQHSCHKSTRSLPSGGDPCTSLCSLLVAGIMFVLVVVVAVVVMVEVVLLVDVERAGTFLAVMKRVLLSTQA